MRLAYLCTDPGVPYGGTKGASVHMGELVSALADEQVEVLLLVATDVDDALPPPRGVTLELLPGPGKGARVAERLLAQGSLATWLEDRLRRFRADALYERFALHSVAGSWAASALGIPLLVELNAPLPEEAAAYRRLEEPREARRLEQSVLSGADVVLAVSRPLEDYARARGARRARVLPNAVAPELFLEPRVKRADPVAVFLGSLRPWHGAETIAAAWRLLGSTAPPLLVVGDGPGRGELESVGAEVTGRLPYSDVPALLASADIGLAPYTRAAPRYFSPLKVFEYLAARLAVVAAELPGVTDIAGREAVVLIPPGDAEALAAAVGELATDSSRRARMGWAGRALVAAEHTWTHRARTVLALVAQMSRLEVAAR